jgi:putative ABC transport system permease protein
MLVLKQAWRHAMRRPLQSLFLILGVAIGVAMIVAIDLANGSAQRAFELGTESVTGRATHTITGGPSGLDEALYVQLRTQEGVRNSAPVVEDYVTAVELDTQPMRLFGVDPFAEQPFRSYLGLGDQSQSPAAGYLSELMATPNTVLLSADVAQRYGLGTGDRLTIRHGADTQTLTIVGLLAPSDELSRRALEGLLIADIASAQELLERVGKLDRIDLIVPATDAGAAQLDAIRAALPPGALLREASARQGTVNEMTRAFRLNLTALSLLALVVGMFLIYNTVTFGVIQRRPVLGSLRALGMTRRQIFALILLEAGVLGLVGTLLGLVLGVLLGRGAVQLVTQTVNDLFFVVSVREIHVPVMTLVKGALIGVAAALLAAVVPAWEATSVPPAGALRRSSVEERTQRALPWITGAGAVLLVVGGLLLVPPWSLVVSFAGLFAVVLGAALLTPIILLALMAGARLLLARFGIIERMAPRTVTRSLSRTAVAVAALMVAVSVIIGVGVMIGSFRLTVVRWLDDVLQADIYVSPPSLQSSTVLTALEPALVEEIRNFPGVVRSATTRTIPTTALVAGRDAPLDINVQALSDDLSGDQRRYRTQVGSNAETWEAVRGGAVLINEPMANRFDVALGDSVTLQTDRGLRSFTVAGISVDFDVNPLVIMDEATYRTLWDDAGVSAVALYGAPDADVDALVNELRAAFAGQENLLVRSNVGTRTEALAVFDRTFAITVALQLLATLVAFIGILSTLMSLQLERTREIGILRATGMTRRQLWRLSLLETGLIGTSAGLLALPTGLLLALILVYIINLRSFGWTLEMFLEPETFVQAFFVALGAALLAGLYPAWRLGRIPPALAVRAE